MFSPKKPPIAFYLLLTGLLLLLLAPVSQGSEKFFPAEKIKPGMKGYGYTVFSGTKIEKFEVKFLDLIDSSFSREKMILVKLGGKEIEEHGGLSAGMSGSPVYIGDRLVGAISYGFENADSSLALVTPIHLMLNLLNDSSETLSCSGTRLKTVPIVTPVLVSGMHRRGYDLLTKLLEPYGLKTVYVPGRGTPDLEMGKDLIRPGSAVAVLMVAGDYQVSAIGTVTWIDGRNFLAFGHSYLNKGQVNYLAYQAKINQTVKSPVMSFKIGSPLKLIGRITQDRQAGISGKLGETPDLIPVRVIVKDEDRNLIKDSSFNVVEGDQFFPDFVVSGAVDAVDQTIDRVGPGTARVAVSIATNASKNNISRQNIFFGKDIAVNCLKDLRDLMEIINSNDFQAVTIKNIRVNVDIKSEQTTARIFKLEAETRKVKPGDTLKLTARLHTYRGENLAVPLEIKIPGNVKPGKVSLTLYGGPRDSAQEDDSKKEPAKLEYKDVQSFEDILANYYNKPLNNELVLEYEPWVEQKFDESVQTDPDIQTETGKPIQQKTATRYYLLGEAQLNLEIVKP
ncbi:MAG: SpoIVB peptidase S55 domain-containing protein [Bacillota bacterium]